MLDFSFATADEIAQELAGRLRAARLAQGLQQSELALRAGVSAGTVKALEKSGQCTVTSLIRVAQALGLTQDLQQAFVLEVRSIAQMEQAQRAQRQRAPRRPKPKGTGAAAAAANPEA
ncbi:MAG: XRE family transcriptional regulator [Aquabacterium sp.]|nr:MAG: XRE family transcriptional regulator [Aquabacterium sp.]